MGALMVLSFGWMIFLGLPTLTYFYAKQLGRNPWRWFVIGIILPGIATLILSLMRDLSEKEEKKGI
jgi:hypothetical protein